MSLAAFSGATQAIKTGEKRRTTKPASRVVFDIVTTTVLFQLLRKVNPPTLRLNSLNSLEREFKGRSSLINNSKFTRKRWSERNT